MIHRVGENMMEWSHVMLLRGGLLQESGMVQKPRILVNSGRAEDSIRRTAMRGVFGVTGVASPGHAYRGISHEPRRAHCFSVKSGYVGAAQSKAPGLCGVMATAREAK